MAITDTNGILSRLEDTWRTKLFEAEWRFRQDRNEESKAEYLRILKLFKNLVLYGISPRE